MSRDTVTLLVSESRIGWKVVLSAISSIGDAATWHGMSDDSRSTTLTYWRSKKTFWRSHNQWFAIISQHLSTEEMEQLSRSRRVGHYHIDIPDIIFARYIIGQLLLYQQMTKQDSSVLTCKNLSILHEECSGPAPSKPFGSIMTNPLCLSHLAKGRINSYSSGTIRLADLALQSQMCQSYSEHH